jgi:hypothetical protein
MDTLTRATCRPRSLTVCEVNLRTFTGRSRSSSPDDRTLSSFAATRRRCASRESSCVSSSSNAESPSIGGDTKRTSSEKSPKERSPSCHARGLASGENSSGSLRISSRTTCRRLRGRATQRVSSCLAPRWRAGSKTPNRLPRLENESGDAHEVALKHLTAHSIFGRDPISWTG